MKQKGRGRSLRRHLLALAAAVLTTAALTLLAAYLMQKGFIPVSWGIAARLTAVTAAALIAGRLSGGTGAQAALIGVGLSLICALGKACVNFSSIFSVEMISEFLLCILFSWAGSCIFHKKKKKNTARNRKKLSAV